MAQGNYEIIGDPLLRAPAPAARPQSPPPDPERPRPAARRPEPEVPRAGRPAPADARPRGAAPAPASAAAPASTRPRVVATTQTVSRVQERPRPADPARTAAAGGGGASDFRPDIEGLRAIAVLAVLLYHADLGPFEGGYVGVDVFFVVSGYLITRLLLNEIGRSGTISLPKFWARRARRLLPASTLVVVATLVAARSMVDPLTQGFVNRSGVAASGFAANILFWTRGGYSQLTLPEPLLHFWSLAVEEQFYLFWPLILVAVVRSGGHVRRLTAAVAGVIAVVSFVVCVGLTPSRQPFTFYWLPARAWELLAGAGLALAGPALTRWNPRARAVGAWVGLGGMVVCMVAFIDPQYGFPGYRALAPVASTVLVIAGGADAPGGPGRLLGLAPMQWVGKHSYALYLWHFPILVLAAAKWGPLSAWQRAGLLVLSVVVAAVSYAVLEDPVRRNGWLAARPARSLRFGGALAATGVLCAAVLLSMPASLDAGNEARAATIVVVDDELTEPAPDGTGTSVAAAPDPDASDAATETDGGAGEATDGTSATDDTTATDDTAADTTVAPTTDPSDEPASDDPPSLARLVKANASLMQDAVENNLVPSNLRPSLRDAYDDRPDIYDDGCILGGNQTTPKPCRYGKVGSDTTVVLFGDSHAAQWFPAFEAVASKRGWELIVMTKQACPTGDIQLQIAGQTSECREWRAKVLALLEEVHPDLLVMASFRYKGSTTSTWKVGLDKTMAEFRPVADQVMILGDTPTPSGDVPSCVAANVKSLKKCNRARSDAVKPHWLRVDEAMVEKYDAKLVTTGDWLCSKRTCPVVVGDVLIYRDESHLTVAAAELLTPYVEAALVPLV